MAKTNRIFHITLNNSDEERELSIDRVLDHGTDGTIFCCDLSHDTGKIVVVQLVKEYQQINEMLTDETNSQFMLTLITRTGTLYVSFSERDNLPNAIATTMIRAREFGSKYSVFVFPDDRSVSSLFSDILDTAGSA